MGLCVRMLETGNQWKKDAHLQEGCEARKSFSTSLVVNRKRFYVLFLFSDIDNKV